MEIATGEVHSSQDRYSLGLAIPLEWKYIGYAPNEKLRLDTMMTNETPTTQLYDSGFARMMKGISEIEALAREVAYSSMPAEEKDRIYGSLMQKAGILKVELYRNVKTQY